jgi:hypothetical protein
MNWLVYVLGTSQVSGPISIVDKGEVVEFSIPLNNQEIEKIEVRKEDFRDLKNFVSGRRDWIKE